MKGAGSEHWWVRYAGPGYLRGGPVWDRGLIWTRPWGFLNWPQTLQQIRLGRDIKPGFVVDPERSADPPNRAGAALPRFTVPLLPRCQLRSLRST